MAKDEDSKIDRVSDIIDPTIYGPGSELREPPGPQEVVKKSKEETEELFANLRKANLGKNNVKKSEVGDSEKQIY